MSSPMAIEMQTVCRQASPESLKPSQMYFPVTHLGEGARLALRAGLCWRLLAVFKHSLYIQSSNGDLVCLGPVSMGAGPLNALYRFALVINWIDRGVQEDASVYVDSRAVQIADRFLFDLAGAQRWLPPATGNYRSFDALTGALALINQFAFYHAPHDSLGYLISGLIERPEIRKLDTASLTAFQQACLNGIARLKSWLGDRLGGRIDNSPPSEIMSLLGLGPGLTPSGDDLLGGALIALHGVERVDIADQLWDWLRQAAVERTNKISLAHMSWAARGSGAAAIHGLMRALFSNNRAELPDCLNALDRIGHTSGWDALAGILLVCNSFLGNAIRPCGNTARISGDERCH